MLCFCRVNNLHWLGPCLNSAVHSCYHSIMLPSAPNSYHLHLCAGTQRRLRSWPSSRMEKAATRRASAQSLSESLPCGKASEDERGRGSIAWVLQRLGRASQCALSCFNRRRSKFGYDLRVVELPCKPSARPTAPINKAFHHAEVGAGVAVLPCMARCATCWLSSRPAGRHAGQLAVTSAPRSSLCRTWSLSCRLGRRSRSCERLCAARREKHRECSVAALNNALRLHAKSRVCMPSQQVSWFRR